jgi:Mce-associated membrane protein
MENLMSGDTEEGTDEVAVDGVVADGVAAEPTGRSTRRNPLVIAGALLVTIATVCAVTFGVLWFNAAHNDSLAFSRMRDDALRAAEQGSINLTTLDYHNVAQGLDRWKQSATGALYTQLTQGSLVSTFTKQAQQAKSVTTGKVLDGVVTDLDEHAGKASALVYVYVTVSAAGSKTTYKRLPLQWQLTMTGSGWKLSGLDQSPTSGQ